MRTYRTTQIDQSSTLTDFAIGQPGFDLLPHDLLQQASAERFAERDRDFLNYGYPQGDERFRIALAEFLTAGYSTRTAPETLLATAGASQALDLICTLFSRPGDTVFVEEPSYFIALRILLEDHQLQPVAIPTDRNGMSIDALEDALARHRPRFVYTIPAFQNPTGRSLSVERRERLVALADEHDFVIVADEVYQLLAYGAPPPPPMASFIDSGRVISVGSFSKILAPGLRLGWIQSAPERIQRMVESGLVDSGGGLNHFTANIVRVALERGWQSDYLRSLISTYRSRIAAMDEALHRHLGNRAEWQRPEGGYFFWLRFAEDVNAYQRLAAAKRAGVGFLPGVNCSSQDSLHNYMRLSFAHYHEPTIQRGIKMLAEAI